MKNLIAMLAVVIVSGCASAQVDEATPENYGKKLDVWVNKPLTELIETWGVPTGEYNVDKDTKLIEYKKSNGKSAVTMYGVTDVVELACTTNFTVQKNIVKSYKFHGNTCRSRPAN